MHKMMSLPRRAILALLCAAFIVGLMPSMALAEPEADPASSGKYDTVEGTYYLSISDDKDFIVSDGSDNIGQYICNMPIDLAEVSKIDLDDYGLGDFKIDLDEDGRYEITLLHVFIYAHLHYYSQGVDGLTITGAPHSSYFEKFFGMDENFNYYVDGIYPMDESLGPGMGATSDAIEVHDGGFCNLGHFADWSFYSDSNRGFRYFMNDVSSLEQSNITLEYNAVAGEDLDVVLAKTVDDYSGSQATETTYKAAPKTKIYYGDKYSTDVSKAKSVTTGSDGTARIRFDDAGTYYVWMPGQYGTDAGMTNAIVAAPTIIKVNVFWKRFDGGDRMETMQMIDDEGFAAGSCANIVLASAGDFPDALCASALAGTFDAPIVTSWDKGSLSGEAKEQIGRLAASDGAKVWIVGGSAAVPASAEAELEAMGCEVERLAGEDRYETGLKIMGQVQKAETRSDTVIVATGLDYADSLSIGPWAYASGSPIVCVGGDGALDEAQVEAVEAGGYTKVLVLGGDARVDYGRLQSDLPGLEAMRIAGKTRVETSASIAEWATGGLEQAGQEGFAPSVELGFGGMGVANAWGFADALPAAGLQGKKGACILLVDSNPKEQKSTFAIIDSLLGSHSEELRSSLSYILGGEKAVSYTVSGHIKSL